MKIGPHTIGEIRKLLAALGALLGIVIAQVAAGGPLAKGLTIAVSVIGAILTYVLPNDAPADPPPPQS